MKLLLSHRKLEYWNILRDEIERISKINSYTYKTHFMPQKKMSSSKLYKILSHGSFLQTCSTHFCPEKLELQACYHFPYLAWADDNVRTSSHASDFQRRDCASALGEACPSLAPRRAKASSFSFSKVLLYHFQGGCLSGSSTFCLYPALLLWSKSMFSKLRRYLQLSCK